MSRLYWMITFDWDSPESIEQIQRFLKVITIIDEIDNSLSSDVDSFAEYGSYLHQASADFEYAPISLSHSLRAALTTSRGALDQASLLIRGSQPPYRITLLALTRSALVSAGRVIYVLGPLDADIKKTNAHMVLRQEGHSFLRGLRAFAKFEILEGLKPPPEFLAEMEKRNDRIQAVGGRRDDTFVLSGMAEIVGNALIASRGDLEGDEVIALAEKVTWVWQTCSGEVHGFGWPGYLPGEFVTDFGTVVSIVHLAFNLATQATQVE